MALRSPSLIIPLFIFFSLNCYGQSAEVDLSVKIPSGTILTEDYTYRINGISTAEDIGGVEVSRGTMTGRSNFSQRYYFNLAFENFNSFPVTVIFEITTWQGNKQTGTIVLRPNEKRETLNDYFHPESFVLIVRKMSS
ncbi:MAG: hypothetical protein FWB89_06330 [Treponema sp.]|nr:hypothetical protein [Treponema sp.]